MWLELSVFHVVIMAYMFSNAYIIIIIMLNTNVYTFSNLNLNLSSVNADYSNRYAFGLFSEVSIRRRYVNVMLRILKGKKRSTTRT